MRQPLVPALLLLLAACETADDGRPAVGTWSAPGEATTTRVLPAAGTAPLHVAVRSEGAWGAAVPGELGSVTVDGESVTLTADGGGVGLIELREAGLHRVGELDIPVFAHSGLDIMPRTLAQDTLIAAFPAHGGAIGQTEAGLWWIPATGAPMPVFDLGTSGILTSVSTGDLDRDGLTDAVVAFDGHVAVLRGHPNAGMVLAGSIDSADRTVTDATIGDVNGDGFSDIAITWAASPRFDLEVWKGDGAFHFEVDATLQLRFLPYSVSVGDNTGEGRPQMTVLDDSEFWTRFVASEDAYAQTGPDLVNITFPANSSSQSADYDGDGLDDLLVRGPLMPGAARELRVYGFVVDPVAGTLPVTPIESGNIGAHVDFADSDNDGRADVWVAQETGEVFLRRIAMDDSQQQRRVWTAVDPGPIAVSDTNSDDLPELFIGGPNTWDVVWGGMATFDTGDWWNAGEALVTFDTGFYTGPAFATLPGTESRLDAIGLVESGVNIELIQLALFAGPEPVVSEINRVNISDDNHDGLAITACDSVAYALTTEEIIAIELQATGPTVLGRAAVSGDRITCGEGPNGAVAAVLGDGTVSLFDADLVSLGSEAAADAFDIALINGTLATCVTADCRVAAAPDGGVARTAAGELSLDELTVPGNGRLTSVDIDGDGVSELLAAGGGDLTVLGQLDDTWVVRQRGHTQLDTSAAVTAFNAFGDSRPVLVGSVDGDLTLSTGSATSAR